MKKKLTIKNELKKMLLENGIDYSDFVSYLNSNLTNALIIESKENTTVINVIDLFVHHLAQETNSQNNLLYNLKLLNNFKFFIQTHHTQLLLEDLNDIIFRDFIEDINTKNNIKLTQSSINIYTILIKKLCTFAAENNLTTVDVSNKFNLRSRSTFPQYFKQDKIEDFFQEINKHKESLLWKTIYITLLGTGLRLSELIALKIMNFNFNDQYWIYVKILDKKIKFFSAQPPFRECSTSQVNCQRLFSL